MISSIDKIIESLKHLKEFAKGKELNDVEKYAVASQFLVTFSLGEMVTKRLVMELSRKESVRELLRKFNDRVEKKKGAGITINIDNPLSKVNCEKTVKDIIEAVNNPSKRVKYDPNIK
jgi:hypothetical protein